MRQRYPRTWAYLERFRGLLASRAAYRRYQQRGPFYSMYNVGPYTMAPVKVVWRRMDRRINAAVVEEHDDPLLGRRPMIPQETCVLVACDSADEAHYVCAVLNSAVVNELVRACSVRGGKGFGTPGMLEFIPLGRFQATTPATPRVGRVEPASPRRRGEAFWRTFNGRSTAWPPRFFVDLPMVGARDINTELPGKATCLAGIPRLCNPGSLPLANDARRGDREKRMLKRSAARRRSLRSRLRRHASD